MNQVFPFGFPLPTAFYLELYVLTFALHQAFMHYVLAGSFYVAWATLFPGRGNLPRRDQPLAKLLRDWMPFMLSAAITAGVAPLLFVQIVYPRHFYTANLLLSWRWMMVIPVLIAAFYLLYVIKSSKLGRAQTYLRIGAPVAVAVCFLFVGFCWTANYLVAEHETAWPEVFRTGQLQLGMEKVLLRMIVWVGGAFATMSIIAAWQLRSAAEKKESQDATPLRHLATLSITGLAAGAAGGITLLFSSPAKTEAALTGALGASYLVVLAIGVLFQLAFWIKRIFQPSFCVRSLLLTTAAALVTLIAASSAREVIRVSRVDISQLYQHHAESAQIGGFAVFLLFAVINGVIIAYCVRLVRRGIKTEAADESTE